MDFKEILEHHILDHRLAEILFPGKVHLYVTKHLVVMWIGSALLILVSIFMNSSHSRLAGKVRLLFEAIVLYIRDEIVIKSVGERGKKYLHYFLTLFFFILVCNGMGLIPGSATPTGNIAVTATVALCTFFLIH